MYSTHVLSWEELEKRTKALNILTFGRMKGDISVGDIRQVEQLLGKKEQSVVEH